MKQIAIDELSVTLRDQEIERLNKQVRRLQARCTQLRQKNDEAEKARDERDERSSEALLLVKSWLETTGQTEDFRQFCRLEREGVTSRQIVARVKAAAEMVRQRRLANA